MTSKDKMDRISRLSQALRNNLLKRKKQQQKRQNEDKEECPRNENESSTIKK